MRCEMTPRGGYSARNCAVGKRPVGGRDAELAGSDCDEGERRRRFQLGPNRRSPPSGVHVFHRGLGEHFSTERLCPRGRTAALNGIAHTLVQWSAIGTGRCRSPPPPPPLGLARQTPPSPSSHTRMFSSGNGDSQQPWNRETWLLLVLGRRARTGLVAVIRGCRVCLMWSPSRYRTAHLGRRCVSVATRHRRGGGRVYSVVPTLGRPYPFPGPLLAPELSCL